MAFTDQIPAGPSPQGAQPRLPLNGEDPMMMDMDIESAMMEMDDLPAGPEDERPHAKLLRWIESKNIAEDLEDSELSKIGAKVIREFEIDDESRADWLEENKEAFDLAMQVAEEKTYPWKNASNVIFPLLTVSAVQFAARAYPAIVSGRNVVKGVVVGNDKGTPKMGPDGSPEVLLGPNGQPSIGPNGQPQINWLIPPGAKRQRADRIADHMSWQLLDEMESWEEDTDKLLHILPIAGCCFRKTYFDPAEGCNVSEIASARNVVINYWAKSMKRAPRISERVWFYPSEIEENERAGVWKEQDYGAAVPSGDDEKEEQSTQDTDAPHEFIEQHRRLDLDDDGYAEPYVVTVHRATAKVVRILARYDHDSVKLRGEKVVRIEAIDYYTKYDFLPNPEGGIYGIGFGKLLMPLNDSVNTIINQLIDAGTLANQATGFIGRGLSMHTGSVKFKMGEFKVVNAPGSRIKDAIVPLQFREPSATLFTLLGTLIDAAKDIASIKDVLTGETAASTMSPTTLMGLIDQGLKVFTGIYKRIHRSAKKEFDKLYRLNRLYLEDNAGYRHGDEWKEITRDDYAKGAGVQPISDPSMVSNLQKLARAELLRSHRGDPMVNQMEIIRREFDAADIPDVESLIVEQPPENPELIAKAAELEMDQAKTRSEEIKNYAQAVYYLAQADKASADNDVEWARHQLDVLRARMEQLNGKPAQGTLPSPEPANDAGEQPPLPGARKARDGNWYLPDDQRPGKFMRIAA